VYGFETPQGIQGSFMIKVYNLIAALQGLPQFPDLDFRVPLPEFMRRNNSAGFATLFKILLTN
jgi:hypothetical protein